MAKRKHFIVTIALFIFTVVGSVSWFMIPPAITKGETVPSKIEAQQKVTSEGKQIVVYLQNMSIELRNGNTLVATLPIISQGKPGSYYETIGGKYLNDYKKPLHFSSIGHVYMPYSVHVFGNYFIHGIPYYPNGEKVSSAYSGGCIRLSDENAKTVYDFVEEGTPIVITRDSARSFENTELASSTLSSIAMTNLMVAMISLEFLNQDTPITDTDGYTKTTRKNILSRLIHNGDTSVSRLFVKDLGEENFIDLMNKKAEALGLTNTTFISTTDDVRTTYDDYTRFMTYISTYKSFLQSF